MKILSFGAGMQSTALALMSCENKKAYDEGKESIYPLVPVYDAIIFCDLGSEPPWVYEQVSFTITACKSVNIPIYVLDSNLYQDFISKYGIKRVVAIPFWSVDENGKKAKMQRHCTLDYKIIALQKFVRYNLLGYKKYERNRSEDISAHEMHIGFSIEERQRIFDSKHPFFTNVFPLVDMKLERKDNYAYLRDVWSLESKASACCICPFHRNYFFKYLKDNHTDSYNAVCHADNILEKKTIFTPIKSSVYISRSRKRIWELTEQDCMDAEYFPYKSEQIWNGF